MKIFWYSLALQAVLAMAAAKAGADDYTDPPAPVLVPSLVQSNTQKRITLTPYPAADEMKMWRSDHAGAAWLEDASGVFSNLTWTATNGSASSLHRLQVTPLTSNQLLV